MKMIELLLTENVQNLGIVGDVVKVRPGYARNFLLPRGMATDPTPGNINRLAERHKQVEQEMRRFRLAQADLIQTLEGYELTLQRSANEQGVLFGGVSQHDIAEALRAAGFEIEDRAVRVGHQIKRLDSYPVPIVLADDLRTEIKLWVVSDKPAEELDTEAAGREEDQAEAEIVAELDEQA
ncbi:MAG: 50S ribosomal protein L9 [Phycisphaeraceae bacterium]